MNLTEVKQAEKLLLNSCGLLQSPNRQDTLAYCYGRTGANIGVENTMVDAWVQLLSTNDDTLSWLRSKAFVFPYHMSSKGRQLEALDNSHNLIHSDAQVGLGYVPLRSEILSQIAATLSSNPSSAQPWIYKIHALEHYYDPVVVLTETGSLYVLKLEYNLADGSNIYNNYDLTQYNSAHQLNWEIHFQQSLNDRIIHFALHERDDLLLSLPDEEKDKKRIEFLKNFFHMGEWLAYSTLENPTLIVSAQGQSFIYQAGSTYYPGRSQSADIHDLGTKLYCISPDGKNKFENFISGEFFSRHSAAFATPESVILIQDKPDKKSKEFVFQVRTINAECQIQSAQQLVVPSLYPAFELKNEDGSIPNFVTEILQVKTTASGDIMVVYLEKQTDWDIDGQKIFPFQLNMAIFSPDGKLKAAKSIISADAPSAWYLHPLPPDIHVLPTQAVLSVELKINADDHSAFISIFNPFGMDEKGQDSEFSENVIGHTALIQGNEYQIQPKFFKLSW